jgi:hypothetical protein
MTGEGSLSRNAMYLVGAILVIVILWVVYSIGGTALSRWFG